MSEKCPTCGDPIGHHHSIPRNHKYDTLYLDILRVGQSVPHTGLSYDHLLSELRNKGYKVDNTCVELAIKHMFFHSFYHIASHDNPCNGLEDIGRHWDCKFILKGEPSLLLLEHDNMKFSSRMSLIAAWIGAVAIIVSVMTLPRVAHFFRLDLDNNPIISTQPKLTQPSVVKLHSKQFHFVLLDSLARNTSRKKSNTDTSYSTK